jgi:pimeloyl-ACP methyl ester carboxylesterase
MSMRILIALILLALPVAAAGVRVLFEPANPAVGPFPSDALTRAVNASFTGRRVNYPNLPVGLGEINQLDGFHPSPRIRVRFSGAIDPDTLREGIRFVWLDAFSNELNLGPPDTVSRINEVAYDPATFTVYARPDEAFDQGRRYALVITDALRDRQGDPVEAAPEFTACAQAQATNPDCAALSEAMRRARPLVSPRAIVGGTVFTTMTVTRDLEDARDRLPMANPEFRPQGAGVYDLFQITSIAFRREFRRGEFRDESFAAPVIALRLVGIGRLGLATYRSPKLAGPSEEIVMQAWIPSRPAPPEGYPVIIAGHGLGDDRMGMPSVLAILAAQEGYAVVSISAVGHGNGPASTLRLTRQNGQVEELPFGGRAVDLDGSGDLSNAAGCIIPNSPLLARECLRQTALDLLQLRRMLAAGVDFGGAKLDGSRVSYVGQSLGSAYGALFLALDPQVEVGVLNVAPDSITNAGRFAISPGLQRFLAPVLGQSPVLLEFPLRHQPVRILSSPLAAAGQDYVALLEWLEASGQPGLYAPYFKSATRPGLPLKRILFQVAIGDHTVPNPSSSALIRNANLVETTSIYRHDLAREMFPAMSADPHPYLVWGVIGSGAAEQAVGAAAGAEVIGFLNSGGRTVPNVNAIRNPFSRPVFEHPPRALPEELNYGNP